MKRLLLTPILTTLLLFSMAGVLNPAGVSADCDGNLLTNGDFATGVTTGWTQYQDQYGGDYSHPTPDASNYYLELQSYGGGQGMYQRVPVSSPCLDFSAKFSVQQWATWPGGLSGRVMVYTHVMDASETWLGSIIYYYLGYGSDFASDSTHYYVKLGTTGITPPAESTISYNILDMINNHLPGVDPNDVGTIQVGAYVWGTHENHVHTIGHFDDFCLTYSSGPEINIIKELVGTMGYAPDSDWAFTGDLNFNIAPGGGYHTSENLTPGIYTITETPNDGYVTSVSCDNCTDCTYTDGGVTIDLGFCDNVTCTFTNTELPSTINIIKEVVGEVPDSDWAFWGTLNFNIARGGGYHTSENLTPDSYAVYETLKDGYTTSVSCDNCTDCIYTEDGVTIELVPGDNVTCTFTNTQTATVNIIKEVVGTAPTDNWTFSGAVSFEFLPSGGTYTHEYLSPQTTYLYRENIKDGYALSVNCTNCQDWYPWMGSFDNGVVVEVGPGDNATCTFTNTAQPSTINIIKELVGDAPDSDWAFTGDLNFNIAPDGGCHTSENLTPGTYNITETLKDGYTASVSCDNCTNCTYADGGVTIDLGPGDNVTCTFINTAEAQPPTPTSPNIFPPAQRPGTSPSSPSTGLCCQPQDVYVQFMRITPQQTEADEPLTILASVANDGIETCTYDVTLAINNKVEQSRIVSVGPQGTQPVKFTVAKAEPGTYTVDILGEQGSFVVLGSGGTGDTPVNSGLIALLIMGVLVLATVLVLLARRPA